MEADEDTLHSATARGAQGERLLNVFFLSPCDASGARQACLANLENLSI